MTNQPDLELLREAQAAEVFLGEWPMGQIMRRLANEVKPTLQLLVQRESAIARLRRSL